MSDSRLNKQKMVNFHPTSSNTVSGLNAATFDGSTLKRPVFYYPLQETNTDDSAAGDEADLSVGFDTISDYSGNANHGRFYNTTGSLPLGSGSSWQHEDVPWGPKLRNGIHKYSIRLGKTSGSAGLKVAKYEDAAMQPYLAVRSSGLSVTQSNGSIATGQQAINVFANQYTIMAWFKPSEQLFHPRVKGTADVMALMQLRDQEALSYRWKDGKLVWALNASAGSTYDVQMRTVDTHIFKPGKWYHIALSRDDENRRLPRVYVNGKRLELEWSQSWAGSNSDMSVPETPDMVGGLYLGTINWTTYLLADKEGFGDVAYAYRILGKSFVGRVAQWIGWNQQLSDRDIYAIYGSCLTSFERKSGYMDLIPVRERLFIKDNKTGSYPTILRSGDQGRMGNYRSYYDDRSTVIFKKHIDVFPGELDKIGKGFTHDDIIGWWRMQELFAPLPTSGEAIQPRWRGRTTLHGKKYNNVVDRILTSSANRIAGLTGYPGTGPLRLSDSGPNALTGTFSGSATFTRAEHMSIPKKNWGPFPAPKEDDLRLMSPDQLSRWGGRTGIFLPLSQSSASERASFVEITEHNKPRMRLVRDLKNNKRIDKPWTISMWVNFKDKGGSDDDSNHVFGSYQREAYQGIFRIENTSGSLAKARILRSADSSGRWQIKFWTYGCNDDDTSVTPSAAIETNYLTQRGTRIGPFVTGSDSYNYSWGMPEGWHHLAFVYRGGTTRSGDRHWRGVVKEVARPSTALLSFMTEQNDTIRGGRMQIWLDGKQLITSATLDDVDNFKRIREPHQVVAYEKKVIFGHYYSHSSRIAASTSVTGSFSGSISEVALIGKALKKRDLNRIINNGLRPPSINVANYPLMINKDHWTMDREPSTDITTYGSTLPGVSDNRITFTKGDGLTPFSDNKTLIATGTNLVGTPTHVAPDLDSPLGSKVSFTINITPKVDMPLLKFNYSGRGMSRASMSVTGSGVGRGLLRALARAQDKGNDPGTFPHFDDTYAAALPGIVRAGGPIEIGDYTGFTYYNFKEGLWEQIGLYDPATGKRIYYDYALSNMKHGWDGSKNRHIMSATYPQQFKPGGYTRIGVHTSEAGGAGYEAHSFATAGRPSMHSLAPWSQIYHATSSQTMRLSDYISQPFLLERVRISIPVNAYREFGGDDLAKSSNDYYNGSGFGSNFAKTGHIRHRWIAPEDNLVFFIYRQTRPKLPHLRPGKRQYATGPVDSGYKTGSLQTMDRVRAYRHPLTVSGSHRYLICSGVACFYNDTRIGVDSFYATASNFPNSYEPLHTPAWKHNWGVQVTSSSAEYQRKIASGTAHGVYTGSIIMDIIPAIQGPTTLGAFRIFDGNVAHPPGYITSSATVSGSYSAGNAYWAGPNNKTSRDSTRKIYANWPGGTSYKSMFAVASGGVYRGRAADSLGQGGQSGWKVGLASTNGYSFTHYSASISDDSDPAGKPGPMMNVLPYSVAVDPRTKSFAGKPVIINSSGTPQFRALGIDDESIVEHPYLLLPEDELIFGMDFLPTIVTNAGNANELTGSYVKLLSTGSATVTFYGSFIREGKPVGGMLNQNLTSNAVHEVVGNEPIFDQFMIADRKEFSGSYIDNLMRGGPAGVRGMYHGVMSGSKSLIFSGNMAHRPRWRQSVVGEDLYKVFSAWMPIDRTGSSGGRDLSSKISALPVGSGSARIWGWGNTPHGGPVWGTKHVQCASTDRGVPTGRLGNLDYHKSYIEGMKSGSATSGGDTFYYSCAGPIKFSAVTDNYTTLGLTMHNYARPLPASLLRGVRLTTQNERYYDSLMPHLGQYAKYNPGGNILGSSHVDTKGTGRPAISLPYQTNILQSGTVRRQSVQLHSSGVPGSVQVEMENAPWSIAGAINRDEGKAAPPGTAPAGTTYPNTSKGFKFIVEPIRRGCFGKKENSPSKEPFKSDLGHGTYSNDKTWDAGSASMLKVGSVPTASINAGVWSGSLAFPFEMSPRRMSKSQRYMLTVFTGTDKSETACGGNRYMHHPAEIRKTLFRIGYQPFIFGNDSDNIFARIASTGSLGASASSILTRPGISTKHHHVLAQYYGALWVAIRGLISTIGPGKTTDTGSYAATDTSIKHSNSAQGFRYGLINTEPMNTTAVFRHDQYGQYRDMLEQRPYTRFFKKVQRSSSRLKIFRSRGKRTNSVVTSGPVTIRFKSSLTGKRIKAIKTNSQNLSPVATSSLPYFDADREGKFRNRPYPFDETILDTAIITDEDV